MRQMFHVRIVARLFVAVVLVSCAGRISSNQLAWKLEGAKIPAGYETYTLFFSTDSGYGDREAAQRLEALQREFKSFGDSIGARNLAVWVNEPGLDRLSVSRGKEFADLFARTSRSSLDYNDGPFVVVCDRHPDLFDAASGGVEAPPRAIVLSFRGVSPDRVGEVLNFVEASIRRDSVDARRIGMQALWVKMKSWWEQTDRTFVKQVILTLITKA